MTAEAPPASEESGGWSKRFRRWTMRLRSWREGPFVIRVGLATGLVVLLVLHAIEKSGVRVDAVSLGLLVLLVLTIVGFDRLEELAAGGLSVKLRGLEEQARSASETLLVDSPEEPPPHVGGLPLSEALIALAEDLRGKLAEIHTYFFDELSPGVPYGSPDAGYVLTRLRNKKLLERQEAAVADRVLDLAREALQGMDMPEEKIWPAMHYVETTLRKIRSTVFRRMVESEVRSAGWGIEELSEDTVRPTEFRARRGEITVRVAAVSAKLPYSKWLSGVIERLGRETSSSEAAALIVIPPRSSALGPAEEKVKGLQPRLRIAPFDKAEATLEVIDQYARDKSSSGPPQPL